MEGDTMQHNAVCKEKRVRLLRFTECRLARVEVSV